MGTMLTGSTKLLGLIGHPVGHSLSPRMHNSAFSRDGADYAYVAMDVQPDRLPEAVEGLKALGFVGFDEACREAGVSLSGRRVLIVGAGGAAAAIAAASINEGASRLHVVNRTTNRAEELCKKLSRAARGTEVLVRPLDEVDEVAEEAEILINATYLGMKEGDPLPIPAEAITADKVVCDAVYLAGRETTLIRCACADGARTVPGGRMLLYQGVQAQRVWTGREPNVE